MFFLMKIYLFFGEYSLFDEYFDYYQENDEKEQCFLLQHHCMWLHQMHKIMELQNLSPYHT